MRNAFNESMREVGAPLADLWEGLRMLSLVSITNGLQQISALGLVLLELCDVIVLQVKLTFTDIPSMLAF